MKCKPTVNDLNNNKKREKKKKIGGPCIGRDFNCL